MATIRPLEEEPRPPTAAPEESPPLVVTGAGPFVDAELRRIEADHPLGLTSAQIIDAFNRRGLRLSEATFRKYVQLNLLPRSRRVGRKGKHQGSCGLYPATTVRRVNAIKRMLVEGLTIEQIQRSLVRFRDEIETLERGVQDLFRGFEREIRGGQFDVSRRRLLVQEMTSARHGAESLFRSLGTLERTLTEAEEMGTRAPVAVHGTGSFGAGLSAGVDEDLV